jgi:uncharacterized cupin superfamily protein
MPAIIKVTRPDAAALAAAGVESWPSWEKEPGAFDWSYDESETCYFLAGRVRVTPAGGQPVAIGPGDLAVFPAGLDCTWEVTEPVRKHYAFGRTPFGGG